MYFKTLLILSSLTLTFIPSKIEYVEATTVPVVEKMDTKEEYIEYVYKRASEGGFEPSSVVSTIKCESGFNKDAINKQDPNGGSHGLAQFQTKTFEYWSKKAGVENGDMYNPKDAIDTMIYMFSQGQQRQWSCWRILYE